MKRAGAHSGHPNELVELRRDRYCFAIVKAKMVATTVVAFTSPMR